MALGNTQKRRLLQEPSLWRTSYLQKGFTDGKRTQETGTGHSTKQPDIQLPKQPDIQPEPRPEEIPQDKDVPEKENPPMQL